MEESRRHSGLTGNIIQMQETEFVKIVSCMAQVKML